MNIILGLVSGVVFGLFGLDATHTVGRIIGATVGAVLVNVVARSIRK